MSRCEDYPCCGHDVCPDYDETGTQTNMRCTCGASVPLGSRSSLCQGCLNAPDPDDPFINYDYREDDEECLLDSTDGGLCGGEECDGGEGDSGEADWQDGDGG